MWRTNLPRAQFPQTNRCSGPQGGWYVAMAEIPMVFENLANGLEFRGAGDGGFQNLWHLKFLRPVRRTPNNRAVSPPKKTAGSF